jgi:hypothetical protein
MAEIALNKSPWDRPGEDIAPYIKRMDDIVDGTATLRRLLYDDLYKDNPDFRIELNGLLFPIEPFINFQTGAVEFRNGLSVGAFAAIIWSAIDPRFTFDPQDPLFQAKYQFSKLIVVLGAGVGAVIGLILNQFIRHMC